MRDHAPLQALARSIWGELCADDAALLHRLSLQVGPTEMGRRLGALGYAVAKGSIDPPTATSWLGRQRPGARGDP